jgi:TolB-like protein
LRGPSGHLDLHTGNRVKVTDDQGRGDLKASAAVHYQFADCLLDTHRRELYRGEALVAVEPQVFDLLAFLLGNREHVASKEDLLASVWGGRIVSDSTLDSRVNAARRAIGDSGKEQRLIRTTIGKGIRFVGTVQERSSTGEPIALDATPRLSIVVLPFANLSNDPQQEYFADRVVEEITTAISRVPWMFVIARNSAFTYKGRAVDVMQVARELGVRYLLEGSVRKAGNRVRIAGQLIDATSNSHLWAGRFDGALDDIFELQDQVASSVVGAIEPRLRLAEIKRSAHKPTGSLDAYDLFLRSLAELHKYTVEALSEAVSLLRRALTLDPDYAPAAAMVGFCHIVQKVQGWGGPVDVAAVVRLAHHAVEQGRDDPEVLAWGGNTLLILGGEHAIATTAFERALTLNPNFALGWGLRAWQFAFLRQPDRAIPAFHQAMRLSPLDPLTWMFTSGLAMAHLAAKQFDEAIAWADRSLHDKPRYISPLRMKLVATAYLGRREAARDLLTQLSALVPGLTLARTRAHLGPAMSPDFWLFYEEGLRRAGLPEE